MVVRLMDKRKGGRGEYRESEGMREGGMTLQGVGK